MKIKFSAYSQIYVIIPILFGFWSMLLGQDRNQDLSAYHLYNGFSFLYNKFDIDYGVAGLRTYFNPLLDAFFYYFNTHLSPAVFGFFMGFLHGLIFIFILDIVKIFLKQYQNQKNLPLIFFVSICCVLTPNFISGLGNSMGDNSTALLNVISIWIVFRNWEYFKIINKYSLSMLAFSGLIFGMSVGLKLTNATYALAFCLSFLLYPTSKKSKFFLSTIFGIFVLLGILVTSGFWFLKLWEHFQNPIFPFFNNLFPNPYSNISIIDNRWGPNNFFEAILWPFIFSIYYHRAGEGLVHQFIWPFFYLLLVLSVINKIAKSYLYNINNKLDQKSIFLISFVVIAFILWMTLFSLQRYLVTIELFVPLAILLLLIQFFSFQRGVKIYRKLSALSLFLILFGGFGTWGHSRWTSPPFHADIPQLKNSNESTVFLTNQGVDLSWIVTQFPNDLSFVKLGLLKDYDVKKYLYVIFPGALNWRINNVRKWEAILNKIGLLDSISKCAFVDDLIKTVKFRGKLVWNKTTSNNLCHLEIRDIDYVNIEQADNLIINKNQFELSKHKLTLNRQSCVNYRANIGGQEWSYIFCNVNKSEK